MTLTETRKRRLDVALNEADLVAFAFDPATRLATVTFLVPTLAAETTTSRSREVHLLLHPVGRIAASLRLGSWDDRDASVVPLDLGELSEAVRACGGMPIYGWDFFDVHERELAQWGDRTSLDWRASGDEPRHSLSLFQDPSDRHLDLCIWFDDLEVLDERGCRIPLDAFLDSGTEWWRAFFDGDERTEGHGMSPLSSEARSER